MIDTKSKHFTSPSPCSGSHLLLQNTNSTRSIMVLLLIVALMVLTFSQGMTRSVYAVSGDTDCPGGGPGHEHAAGQSCPGSDIIIEDPVVVSITFDNPTNRVWQGSQVTWTIETSPSGHENTVTTSLGAVQNGKIVYNCPDTSATESAAFVPTAILGESSASANTGPVVYAILDTTNDTKFDPKLICRGQGSVFVVGITPGHTHSPTPSFSSETGAPAINAAGHVSTTSSTNPGNWDYIASGGSQNVTRTLSVLTDVAGEWTSTHIPSFTWPAAPLEHYDAGPFEEPDGAPVPRFVKKKGKLYGSETIDFELWQDVSCGESSQEDYEYTINGSIPFDVYGVTVQIGASYSVTNTIQIGPTSGIRIRWQWRTPGWKIMDDRHSWQEMYGHGVDTEWRDIDPSVVDTGQRLWLAGADAAKQQACCTGGTP